MSIESRSRQYGKVFDHWQIREFLGSGSGGKSAVFRLVHSESSTVYSALKVISLIERRGKLENLSDSRRAEYECAKKMCKDHAEREVLLMNGLQGQSNVVGYFDHTFINWEDDTGFGCDMLIRMELLKDLRGQIEAEYPFSQDEVIKIGRDICNALVLCHRKEILHRDIKPENIFYNEDGNYKLGDFGVSRILSATPMSKASTGVCTPEYAAPEQMSGKYDTRVDIYSLGLVLYELSNNGLLPFASSSYISEYEVQERMIGKPFPAPRNASSPFAAVILKACAYHPDDRYQTAEELLAELDDLANKCAASVPKAQSVGRGTQKATPSVEQYTTQYAKPEEISGIVSEQETEPNQTEWAVPNFKQSEEPFEEPVTQESFVHTAKPKQRKKLPIMIGAVAGILVAIMVAIFAGSGEKEQPVIDNQEGIIDITEGVAEPTGLAPIIAVDANDAHVVALRSDGTVSVAVRPQELGEYAIKARSNTGEWSDIIAVSAGVSHTVGLKADGTVVATGGNTFGECDVSAWTDIVAVSAGLNTTYGLKSDGTVVSTGAVAGCMDAVSNLKDIICIEATNVGLECLDVSGNWIAVDAQGEVDSKFAYIGANNLSASNRFSICLGESGFVRLLRGGGYSAAVSATAWENIIALSASDSHIVGLTENGTVVTTDWREMSVPMKQYGGDCNAVVQWKDIIQVCAGDGFTVGLKADGTIVAVGDDTQNLYTLNEGTMNVEG